MNPSDVEFAELRARLERLEARVAQLEQGGQTVPATTTQEPPLIVQPAKEAIPSANPKVPVRRPISSTAWVAAVGACIFLLGAAYGLAVSIERGWISPPVRVGAGLVLGAAIAVFAARLLLADRRTLGVALLAVGTGLWTFALYFGAQGAALFPLGIGFGGAALAVIAGGLLAARAGSDGAMTVAMSTGLVAPLAFATGQGTVAGLAMYLAVLLGAQLAVSYAAGAGGSWKASRGLALSAVWFVLGVGVAEIRRGDPVLGLAAIALLGAVALGLAWLPRHPESPWGAAGGSMGMLGGVGLAAYGVWRRARWNEEAFSMVLAGLAAVALGLIFVARARAGNRCHDRPLLLAALALTLLALLTALEAKWAGLAWSLIAAVLAWTARRDRADAAFEARAINSVAVAAAALATVHWVFSTLGQDRGEVMFANPVFGAALFTGMAWIGLIAGSPVQRGWALAVGQLVLVNAVAWEFARTVPTFSGEEATLEFGPLLATLTYAGAGAGGWLRGVLHEQETGRARAWRLTGYGWLTVAAVKLLGFDLEHADLAFRAVAALAVGALFIGAAYWADRKRPQA